MTGSDVPRAPLGGDVRRVVVGRFVSHVGGSAGFFVGLWGLAAYELDATPSSLALLMAALAGARLFGSALAGILVDRLDPRRVLLMGEVAFVPAILTLTTATSMTQLTVRAPVAWFASSLVTTAVASFPPYLVAGKRRVERANALLEAAGTIAFVVGPLVGALTVRWFNVPAVFALDALTSVVAVAIVVPVQVRRVECTRERKGWAELASGFRVAYRTPPVALVMVLGTLTWMSFGAFSALEPLFFRDVLGSSAEVLGYVNAVFGVTLTVGAVVLDRSAGRLTMIRTVVVLTAGGGLGAVIYAGTPSIVVVVAAAAYWGVVLGVLLPLLRTLTHLHTPEAYLGRVTGIFSVHHSVGELLPLAVAPALAGIIGVQGVLVSTGVLLMAAAPLAWRHATRIDATHPVLMQVECPLDAPAAGWPR